MLALEFFGDVLGPGHGRRPAQGDLRRLRSPIAILDADRAIDVIAVGPKAQRLRDPKPEAVLADERDLARGRAAELETVRRQREVDNARGLPSPLHRHPARTEPAGNDHRLFAAIDEIPGGELAAVTRHPRTIQRPCDPSTPIRY